MSKGIEKNRVYTEGKGEKQPVADNKTKEGQAKNRRVEIEVVGTRMPTSNSLNGFSVFGTLRFNFAVQKAPLRRGFFLLLSLPDNLTHDVKLERRPGRIGQVF